MCNLGKVFVNLKHELSKIIKSDNLPKSNNFLKRLQKLLKHETKLQEQQKIEEIAK